MEKVAGLVISHSRLMLALFGLLTVLSGLLIPSVRINYNLADYVPERAASTVALHVMEDEFDDAVPNVRVFVPDVGIVEALEVKDRIAALPAIDSVIWLDDFIDLKQPLDVQDPDTVESFYTDGGALYQVSAGLDTSPQTMVQLQEVATPAGAVEGQLIDLALAQMGTSSEVTTIMLIMVPLGVILLLFSTRSWLDPVILLVTIGVAVVLNMGSNVLLGEVSFLTQAVTGVLQLAVSMDYGIFLMHARERHAAAGVGRRESLQAAVVESSTAILAASTTTILGFLALVFMSFRLGPDLGIVLAKGVLFSLLCVILFMPALMTVLDRWAEATTHRPLLPDFGGLGRVISRAALWLLAIGVVLPFCFIAQGMNDFRYGTTDYPAGSREAADRVFIQEEFGRHLPMALLVPRGDWGREYQLEQELSGLPEVIAIASYQSQVGRLLPSQVLPQEQLSSLLSENYSRIVLTVDSDKEGVAAFALVDRVRAIAQEYYPDRYHLTGESVVTSDMKVTITADNLVVNGLAMVTVGLVLLISFRSLIIPFLLVLTIEGSIWINLTVPYLTGTHLAYIGYLVVSTVQLGATVDYAILFTQHYLANREHVGRREAVARTVGETFGVLLIPALILMSAGLILAAVSSLEVVSQLGTVLGRGAALSFVMVYLFLPGLLLAFDPVIEKTTWKARFVRSSP